MKKAVQISRRRFLYSGSLAAVSLGVTTGGRASEGDLEAELRKLEIVPLDYKAEIVKSTWEKSGLIHGIQYNSSDKNLYVIGRKDIWKIVDGKEQHAYHGAGDPYGDWHVTKLAFDSQGKAYIYGQDWLDAFLAVYSPRGDLLLRIEGDGARKGYGNFTFAGGREIDFEDLQVNPVNGKLHVLWAPNMKLSNLRNPEIKELDTEKKAFKKAYELDSFRDCMSFDSEGNLYCFQLSGTGYYFNRIEDEKDKKYKMGVNFVKLPGSVKEIKYVKTVLENETRFREEVPPRPGEATLHNDTFIAKFAAYNPLTKTFFITGLREMHYISPGYDDIGYHLLELDPLNLHIKEIARVRDIRKITTPSNVRHIVGMDVASNGDIYVALEQPFSFSFFNGRTKMLKPANLLVKLKKKA